MEQEYLNCDAEGCDHVEVVGRITAEMVDMPCPVCGSNLLTEEDWQAWQPMADLMRVVSDLPGAKGATSLDGKVSMRVGLHGKKTTIEIEPVAEKPDA